MMGRMVTCGAAVALTVACTGDRDPAQGGESRAQDSHAELAVVELVELAVTEGCRRDRASGVYQASAPADADGWRTLDSAREEMRAFERDMQALLEDAAQNLASVAQEIEAAAPDRPRGGARTSGTMRLLVPRAELAGTGDLDPCADELTVRLCVSDSGAPTLVTILHGSAMASVDRLAVSTLIHTWRFEPYAIGDHSFPFCERVTFEYTLVELARR